MKDDVAAVQNDVTSVHNDVTAVQDDVTSMAADMERNSADITSLGVRGHWCVVQDHWNTVGTITYDTITYSDSNLNIATTPLDINTGINSHKCYYQQDIDICNVSGIFTVPLSGAWRLSFSIHSVVGTGDTNSAYLYINDYWLEDSKHQTYSSSHTVQSTGGREVTLDASAGDKIEVRST